MTRAFFLPLLLTALASAAPRSGSPAPDLALSASFLPPRYVVEAPDQRDRVRNYLSGLPRDSAQRFSLRGNVLTLSHAFAERLAAEEGGAGEEWGAGEKGQWGQGGRSRLRARLNIERAVGAVLEEDAPAFPAEYLPGDLALQTTPQWGLRNDGTLPASVAGMDVNMPRVWEQFDGADTLVIAVLDAGINFHHPDLRGRWLVNQAEAAGQPGVDDDSNGFVDDSTGWDFVDGDNNPQDFHSHGTLISGIITAAFDNGIGVAGMLPRARILPVRVLSTAGYGTTADIANGIRYAAAMGAHVINFSIGIGGTGTSSTLRNAFIAARDSGVIVAAASANDGVNLDPAPTQPASYKFDNIYMVAAHAPDGALAGFSNYGATTVDLAAPGVGIITTTIPPSLTLFQENFQNFAAARWTIAPAGSFQVGADTIEGASSLKWISGVRDTVQIDTLDLRGRRGGVVTFQLQYTRSSASDLLSLEVQKHGSTAWTSLVAINGNVSPPTALAYNLGPVDGSLFRMRFRTVGTGTAAGRVIRIDDLRVKYADEDPGHQAVYDQNSGTSLAAPFVAGYAALMRLATTRAGVPFTRARMLAGTVPVPALSGKLITGGRLDVAKGLDFYLRTVPRITVSDSADTSWNSGAPVDYALAAADSAGPRPDFTFSAIGALPGGTLSPAGLFSWNSQSAPQGGYVLRAKAVSGPVTLRKMIRFALVTPVPVAFADPGRPSVLRIGSRAFVLPPAAFARGRHALRLEFYGADGRTVETATGELVIPPGARRAEYRLPGFRGVGLRAWLDGVALRPTE